MHKRLLTLFKLLNESDDKITCKTLSNHLKVSERTIRNDITSINGTLEKNGAIIKIKKGEGYYIDILNLALYQQYLALISDDIMDSSEIPDSPIERNQYILKYILYNNTYIKLEDLANSLYVSKFTILNDIKRIKPILSKYNLILVSKPYYGVKVEGRWSKTMIKIINAFKQEFEQIKRDAMLFIVCVSPILCGVFIKFGIPLIQNISLNKFYYQLNLEPYFLMFDLLLAFITPFMFFFASTMVILGEIDDSISRYLIVTPLGKTGYLISRFGIPGILAFIITMILLIFFSLTKISLLLNLSISLLVLLQGVIISILVISLSSNKLEGMVITKFSGVFMMGILAPFFILNKAQYILFFLPTFWISKAFKEDNYVYMFISIVISLIWILLLFKKFSKKIVK